MALKRDKAGAGRWALGTAALALSVSLSLCEASTQSWRTLKIAPNGNGVTLSWELGMNGAVLEESLDFSPLQWSVLATNAQTPFPIAGVEATRFYRLRFPEGSGYIAGFQTDGATFEPEVTFDTAQPQPEDYYWMWNDGLESSDYPVATKNYGSPDVRRQWLNVHPAEYVTAINLGFDGLDGGQNTPLNFRPAQNVSEVYFPSPLAGLKYWASSYNPISALDFTGFANLEVVECYRCAKLQRVGVNDLPSLKRLCVEACNLRTLDISGLPKLADLRAALNAYTNISVGRGTGPLIWHWCVRDNPQVQQNFTELLTNSFLLREFLAWNANQSGVLSLVSTNLSDLEAYRNRYNAADLSGQRKLRWCLLYNNELTNVVLDGCVGLLKVDAHGNRLPGPVLDQLIETLEATATNLQYADFSQNAGLISATHYVHARNLVLRGVDLRLDWPPDFDGRLEVGGGTNAVTFVTVSQHPSLEIQTDYGVATNVVWHWGDGSVSTNTLAADHDFGAPGLHTNYVRVFPPACVSYFGAPFRVTTQGIQEVYGLSNFPRLSFLYLFRESVTKLSLAGCSNLVQLHLAENPTPVAVCDQWFLDLDQAVVGPVSGADFFYPADGRSSASDPAWTNLVNKGYLMHPF